MFTEEVQTSDINNIINNNYYGNSERLQDKI